MVRARGIEVSAGGFEVRSIALGVLMEVDGVHSGGEVLQGEMNRNPCFSGSMVAVPITAPLASFE